MKIKRLRMVVAAALLAAATLTAPAKEREEDVDFEFTYRCPSNISPEQAKIVAEEQGRLEACARTFGTNVSYRTSTVADTQNTSFHMMSTTDVRGVWIKRTADFNPRVEVVGSEMIVTGRIKGRVREITSATPKFEYRIMRNGVTERDATTDFYDNDRLYISFVSPENGYIAVFSRENDKVKCVYPREDDEIARVIKNRPMTLFAGENDGIVVHCDNPPHESLQLMVMFSPREIKLPVSDKVNGDIHLYEFKKFENWFDRLRSHDHDLQYVIDILTITAK